MVNKKPWRDGVATVPHRQDMSAYKHFNNVELHKLPDNKSVDRLIGNHNAFLMRVLEEMVGMCRSASQAIVTPLN